MQSNKKSSGSPSSKDKVSKGKSDKSQNRPRGKEESTSTAYNRNPVDDTDIDNQDLDASQGAYNSQKG
jgi:hypothetical protein